MRVELQLTSWGPETPNAPLQLTGLEHMLLVVDFHSCCKAFGSCPCVCELKSYQEKGLFFQPHITLPSPSLLCTDSYKCLGL